ncbi:sensor histidine kinase [Paenibacillus macerans]|uniref:sensor histidine kinase n=1 Tax=Paenibacillus macerans TaxID=44252 RepID=UPI002E21BA02|nr:sensor histidine kinase [Paenibacillus macerans]
MSMFFRRGRRRFRDFRLSSKLLIVYVALTVLPISLLGVISYRQYEKSIVQQIGEYMPKFLDQANGSIDQHIGKLAVLPEQLFSSTDVVRILRKDSYQSNSDLNTDTYVMNNYLSKTFLEGSNSEILGVFILSKNRLFSASRLDFTGLDSKGLLIPYGQDLELRGGAKLLLSSDFGLKFSSGEPYLMITKQIDDVDNRTSLGTMFIAVQMSFIDRILQNFERNEQAEFWLLNGQGEIFYHTDRARIGGYDAEIREYPVQNGSFRKQAGGKTWIMSSSRSAGYGWRLMYSIPLKELTKQADITRNIVGLLFAGFALVTLVLYTVFSYRVTRPLMKLARLMKEVGKGRFDVDPGIQSRDEVGMLARSFTFMVSMIRELIAKNVQTELSQKEAELYALQSQINPHFMYNTLESISMAAEEEEQEAVVKMVTLLGRMLRFSVSNKSRWVTIAEEVQHVRDYLTIQAFRFEERLDFTITEEVNTAWYTPKFILQPIVENAVKYGMESRRSLKIGLHIAEEPGTLPGERQVVFRIRDNGPGIGSERLEALNRELQSVSMERKDSGFGLKNVNARIHYMLGSRYGLQMESMAGEGTTVIIRIPAIDRAGAEDLKESSKEGQV